MLSRPHAEALAIRDSAIRDQRLDHLVSSRSKGPLPRALSGHIVSEEQLDAKIEHGNSQDVNHSTYAIDADLFITADRAFCDALRPVRAAVPAAAPPAFLNRAGSSIVEHSTSSHNPRFQATRRIWTRRRTLG